MPGPARAGLPRRGLVWVRLHLLQPALEITALDGAHEGFDEPGDFAGLARGDAALRQRPHDRRHRARYIAGVADRWQVEQHLGLAARRQHAFEAEPHRAPSPFIAISTALRVSAAASPSSSPRAAS